MNPCETTSKQRSNAGFALIASLSIMAVLVLIGVTLYSLSSVATKSAEIAKARTEAQANAKMALMMAIGDLQKNTGADTRVTALADLFDPDAPVVVGAWKSWEGLNHVADTSDSALGRPIAPNYSIKNVVDTSPDKRFLSWLVSGDKVDGDGDLISPLDLVFEEPDTAADGTKTVPLLTAGDSNDPDDGSLSDNDNGGNPREIHVFPTQRDRSSRYAWWVSPENQKARLAQPHEPRENNAAGWMEVGQSHLVPDPSVFGFDSLLNTPEPFNLNTGTSGTVNKAVNRDSLALLDSGNSGEPEKRFHDLSTSAVGLLTNTATGGWRKDLSLLTEKWDDIYNSYPGGELPLFRLTTDRGTGATSQVPRPTTGNYDPEQSNLYPWSEYSTIIGNEAPNTHHAASASWQSLANFATAYKNFSFSSGTAESSFVWDAISSREGMNDPDQKMFNYKHTQRLYPQVARFQFLIYARAFVTQENQQDPTQTKYEVRLMYVPIFTLWNPYNLRLFRDIPNDPNFAMVLGWRKALPGAMAIVKQSDYISADSVPESEFRMLNSGNLQYLDIGGNHGEPAYDNVLPDNVLKGYDSHTRRGHERVKILGGLDIRSFGANLPSGRLQFEPGEVKMFSPDGRRETRFGNNGLGLEEGYDPTLIEGFVDFRVANNVTADESFWFLYRPDTFTKPFFNRAPGMGFVLSFGEVTGSPYTQGDLHGGVGRDFHNLATLVSADDAANYWPPSEVAEKGISVGALATAGWTPMFSISFGPRMTIGTAPGDTANRPTKGLVQNNPLVSYVLGEPGSANPKDHPVNGTFDFAYHSLAGQGTNITPSVSDSAGFMATGYQEGDGLSRLILAEIPLRPMASLIELQGWNPRGNNPYPPFQMNLIGNSDATPLIPSNNVVPTELEPSGDEFNLQHDDAYSANHLLFDDWFLSSIAAQPDVLGGNIAKNVETFYQDFLTGQEELSNRAYQPIPEDSNLSSAEAADRADEIIDSADGWLKVASRLEVDGMFNVNSTSVDAWRALLRHAKSRDEIALYGDSGIESTTGTNPHSITRGAAAFNVEAGSGSGIGGANALETSEYTGFRSLTDAQIDELAERIVEQVRARGPFLSLAEFINRQLLITNDDPALDELALAGAVQTAINNLSTDPMATLRDPNNSMAAETMLESNGYLSNMNYEYPLAAENRRPGTSPEDRASSAYGVPGDIRQADILRPIAPILSARDDTFTIRAYGDKLDESGRVVAQAWCEAVVKRSRHYCDPADPADSVQAPASPTNIEFGRKYEIVAFRWLSPDEV